MNVFEVGRLCMKVAGREAGRYCVVIKKMDENFVMVTGPKELTSVKRRRCNINHLEPLMETLKIKSDAPDGDVLRAYQEANLTKKLNLGTVKPAPRPSKKKEKPEKKPRKLIPSLRKKPEPKKEKPKPAVKKESPKPAARKTVKKPAAKKTAPKKAPAKSPARKASRKTSAAKTKKK
jgi:large subunit ribosomal protein L14e